LLDSAPGLPGFACDQAENQGLGGRAATWEGPAGHRPLPGLPGSDDVVDAGMYGTLVAMAESEQLDIAMCNAWNFHRAGSPTSLVYRDVPDTGVITG